MTDETAPAKTRALLVIFGQRAPINATQSLPNISVIAIMEMHKAVSALE